MSLDAFENAGIGPAGSEVAQLRRDVAELREALASQEPAMHNRIRGLQDALPQHGTLRQVIDAAVFGAKHYGLDVTVEESRDELVLLYVEDDAGEFTPDYIAIICGEDRGDHGWAYVAYWRDERRGGRPR